MINNKINSFFALIFLLFFLSLTPNISQASVNDCRQTSIDGRVNCSKAVEIWAGSTQSPPNTFFYTFNAYRDHAVNQICKSLRKNDTFTCENKNTVGPIDRRRCSPSGNSCNEVSGIKSDNVNAIVRLYFYSNAIDPSNPNPTYGVGGGDAWKRFSCPAGHTVIILNNYQDGFCKPTTSAGKSSNGNFCPTGTCPGSSDYSLSQQDYLQGAAPTTANVDANMGTKYIVENDYIYNSSSPIGFTRLYNSQTNTWSNNWNYQLSYTDYNGTKSITATLPNGSSWYYQYNTSTNSWSDGSTLDTNQLVVDNNNNIILTLSDHSKITFTPTDNLGLNNDNNWVASKITTANKQDYNLAYDNRHNLETVTNPYGNKITFKYENPDNACKDYISSIEGVETVNTIYNYNSSCNLIKVTYSDNTFKTYEYPSYSLNTIKNELNTVEESTIYNYVSSRGGNVVVNNSLGDTRIINKVSFSYNGGYTNISDTFNHTVTMNVSPTIDGKYKPTGYSSLCTWCNGIQGSNLQYNANGYINQITDYLGNITQLSYDLNTNNVTQVKESTNNSALTRQKDITYDTTWNKVSTITEPSGVYSGGTYNNRITTYTYDSSTGQVLTMTITAPTSEDNSSPISRSINYTYNSLNQLVEVSNPRSEKTSYTYNSNGQIDSITNNLNQTTSMSNFNSFGYPQNINYPDNTSMSLTYNLRGKVIATTKNGITTTLTRALNQLVTQVTSPSGAYKKLYYDTTQRLNKIEEYNESNQLQGYLVYTLDNMSNPTKVQVLDSSGVEIRLSTKQYNTQNLLYKDLTSLNYANTYTYDLNGNIKTVTDPNNGLLTYNYDSLNRISSQINPDTGTTSFTYNPDDSIATVVAPTNQTTTYKYNGFGEVVKVISPDTATTVITRNDSGQVIIKTDARGINSTYTYDELGRVATITYPNSLENVNITYDSCNNGVGKVCSIHDVSGNTNYSYNNNSYLESKNIVSGAMNKTLTYGYDNFGRLNSLTYPSGLVVNYSYTNDKINSINYTSGVSSGSVITNGVYDPFNNEIKLYSYGNGSNYSKVFNKDGLVSSITSSNLNNTYGYDSRLNINSINSGSIAYDNNSRVTSFNGISYAYNQNDNRTSAAGNTYNYTTGSNKLNAMGSESYGYDLAGNQTSSLNKVFSYNNAGKLSGYSDSLNSFSYVLNSLSERVAKINNTSGEITNFMYEGSSLLGEYKNGFNQEYIYLNGQVVGIVKNGILYNIYNDHLGTPRLITDQGNNIVWKWENVEAYGNNIPSIQNIEFNLRFAGQYFDNENGMHYNINRIYNPKTGRYISSDPLGLEAGSNTYGYVGGNPLSNIDPLGLITVNMGLLTNHWTYNFVDSFFLYAEGLIKEAFDFNKKLIRVTSHGSTNTLNHNSPEQLANQIISGQYQTNPNWWQKNGLITNNTFENLLQSGEDIIIELDACNTGAYYRDEKGNLRAFGDDLAKIIKSTVIKNRKNNKVIVKAPNGLTGWNLGLTTVSKPNQSPELNGTKGKINVFIY